MRFIWTIALGAVASASVQAAIAEPSRLQFGLSLYGYSAESAPVQSRIAGTEIQAEFERPLSKDLDLQVTGGLQVETGFARMRYPQDFHPRQIQRVRQAQLRWTPFSEWQFIVGAVDQMRWGSPLLLQRQTFPALFEAFEKRLGAFVLGVQLQQAIPSDTSSLQRWGNWPQGLPGFYFERLSLAFNPHEQFEAGLTASHFLFENLSGPTAYQAQYLGNTINGMNDNTTYVYGFQGFEWGVFLKARLRHWHPRASFSLLQNGLAPQGKSQGLRAAGGAQWDTSPSFHLRSEVELFRMESDVAPAFYQDRAFGHSNRSGFGVVLTGLWLNQGIQTDARWIHSAVLSTNRYQSDLDWIQFQLSAQYDVL